MGIAVERCDGLLGAFAHELVCRSTVLDADHGVGVYVCSIEVANVEITFDEVVRPTKGVRAFFEDNLREVAEQEPDLISVCTVEEHNHPGAASGNAVPLLGIGRTGARRCCGLPPKGV